MQMYNSIQDIRELLQLMNRRQDRTRTFTTKNNVKTCYLEIGDADFRCALWTFKQQLDFKNASALWNFYCSPETSLYCDFRDTCAFQMTIHFDGIDLNILNLIKVYLIKNVHSLSNVSISKRKYHLNLIIYILKI